VPIRNPFQIKLKKGSDKMKMNLNKEHEHDKGIVTDVIEEKENAFDSMRINSESVSKEINESDSQYEKQREQII
jgi:Fe-S cluster assembly ATPase SufC